MGIRVLDKRLIFVTGKGGVGKSTVALALGLAAARTGRRVIVAELAGNDRLQRTFGLPGAERFQEVQLAPALFTISVEPQQAMEEYLSLKLPGPAGVALSRSKLFGVFAMATPGMRELLSVGKIWELSQLERRTPDAGGYDLVIVDAPASGHGVGLLRTPRTFSEIARVGPIAAQGARIADTIADRDFTGVVAVTTAEEMPVNETLQVRDELEQDGLGLDAVFLNGRYRDRFSADDVALVGRWHAAGPAQPGVDPALAAALSQHARRATQREQEERLFASFRDTIVTLPYLFVPQVGQAEVGALADVIAEQLPDGASGSAAGRGDR